MLDVSEEIQVKTPMFLQHYTKYVSFIQTDHPYFDLRMQMVFENRMGISILHGEGCLGSSNYYEIACLGRDGSLAYDDYKYTDVCAGLKEDEVVEHIEFIKNHDWPLDCGSCGKRLFFQNRDMSLWWRGNSYCSDCTREDDDLETEKDYKLNKSGYCVKDLFRLHQHLKDAEDFERVNPIFESQHFPLHELPERRVCNYSQMEICTLVNGSLVYSPCDCDECKDKTNFTKAPF